MQTILDFHIRIESQSSYRLEIFRRDQSQPLASARFEFPLSFMIDFELSHLEPDHKDPAGRVERLRKFGAKLYDKLFNDEVKRVWQEQKSNAHFLTLCIRTAADARGLEALPWETLFDGEEFIAAGVKTSVSRLPLDAYPQDDLPAIPLPLRMLSLVSSPLDLPDQSRLQIEREQEILLEAVNSPAGQGKLSVDFEDEARLDVLETALEAGYHILHFTGHGIPPEAGGGLLLEDAEGKSRATSVGEVIGTLQKGADTLRLAVISGCQTARTLHAAGFRDLARGLIEKSQFPAVIAMQFSITDTGGLKLAEKLYPRLIEGQPLEIALSRTRRDLLLSDDHVLQGDAFAPVLITTNGGCLKSREAEIVAAPSQPVIDYSFHLPLPQLSFGFYGRRREYREIRDALVQRNHCAVIIHGIGGIGKTALVSHTATRLRRRFRGVYAFDCSGGGLAPERIVAELHRYFELQGVNVLERLVYQPLPPDTLANFLAQVLTQWPLLVIFDNFETQLAREGETFRIDENLRTFIGTLVKATAAGSRFIFASRYLFDVDEKRLGTIQSLSVGDLSRPEALSLMQKLPNLRAASYDEKIDAYRTFGGHPYALVALDRHCGFRKLSDALKDAGSVHAELREFLAIEINYARLSERARELLNRLAAFRQGVTFEAAKWVMGQKFSCAADVLERIDPSDWTNKMRAVSDGKHVGPLELMSRERDQADNLDRPIAELIEWGLLTPVQNEGQVESLAVHSLVRDFCRANQAGETWRIRLREAAGFYLNLTKLTREDDKTPAAVWGEMEAFELLMEAEDFEHAGQLLLAADALLDRWGFGRYVESQYPRLLNRVDRSMAATIIHNQGVQLQGRGEYADALEKYEQSRRILEELGDDRSGLARSLHQIGMIHQDRGEYAEALDMYEQSLRILEELEDQAGVASSLHQIGMIHQYRGQYANALDMYRQSRLIAEGLDDRVRVAKSLHQIAMIHQDRREYGKALEKYEQSRRIAEELGDRAGVARSLHNIGAVHHDRGEYGEALEKYEQSLRIAQELGDQAGVARLLHQIGIVHQDHGEYGEALAKYRASLSIKEQIGDRFGVAISQGQVGKLLMQLGQYGEAFEWLLFALTTFVELQSRNTGTIVNILKELRATWGEQEFDADWKQATGIDTPQWLTAPVISPASKEDQVLFAPKGPKPTNASEAFMLADQYVNAGRWYEGLRLLEESLILLRQGNDSNAQADVIYQIARTHHLMGNLSKAAIHYRDAVRLYRNGDNRRGQAAAKLGLGKLLLQIGSTQKARIELQQSRLFYADLDDQRHVDEVDMALKRVEILEGNVI